MSKPESPQNYPYAVEVEKGNSYYWCSCGKSNNQPFCYGSHQGTDFTSIELAAEESTIVYFCGCKKTGNRPVCDGSHTQ